MCWRPVYPKEHSNRIQRGYTLVELSLVVVILAIMAAAVIPHLLPADSGKLQVAAQEVADAMRYARSESMRLREPRGFRYNADNMRLRMFSLDTDTTPWTSVYDVYHPVSKKLYDFFLDEHHVGAIDGSTQVHNYRGSCNLDKSIYFDVNGTPFCTDPHTVPVSEYEITLALGEHQRTVSLNPLTGQVKVE